MSNRPTQETCDKVVQTFVNHTTALEYFMDALIETSGHFIDGNETATMIARAKIYNANYRRIQTFLQRWAFIQHSNGTVMRLSPVTGHITLDTGAGPKDQPPVSIGPIDAEAN